MISESDTEFEHQGKSVTGDTGGNETVRRSSTEALAHTQMEVHPNRRLDSTLNGKATGCCQCPS
eukprot:336103-Pelagomonas_calceolata.AAC.1